MSKKTFIQFIMFGIVGFSNTAISYCVYAILTYLGVQYLVASIIAFIVSVLNSFFWNNKLVFKKTENEIRNTWWSLIKTFISYASTGLILNNVILVILVEKIGVSKYIAPIFSLVVTIPLNFIINKCWSFRTTNIKENTNEENKCNDSLL